MDFYCTIRVSTVMHDKSVKKREDPAQIEILGQSETKNELLCYNLYYFIVLY